MPIEQKRVYIINDETDFLDYLVHLIKSREWAQVRVFADEVQGLEACLKSPPDCLILDLDLPNLKGDEICSILRSSKKFGDVPIFVVTQIPQRHRRRNEIFKFCANAYLERPFLDEEFLEKLNDLLFEKALSQMKSDSPLHTTPQSIAQEALQLHDIEIISVIGGGGMGTVYKARQIKLDRLVAIKVLSPRFRSMPLIAMRFDQEARILARVSHPNIVQIYDVGASQFANFFVMEYVNGINLAQKITRESLTVPQALSIIKQISDALVYLHSKGIVHRDVKPSNILISGDGVVKLTDFGISHAGSAGEATSSDESELIIGSPDYMAPEIREGEPANQLSDQYSFGLTVWCMLARRHPQKAHHPLKEYRKDLPEALSAVLAKCTHTDPMQRFPSMDAAREAILEICGISSRSEINYASWITNRESDLFSVPTLVTPRHKTQASVEVKPDTGKTTATLERPPEPKLASTKEKPAPKRPSPVRESPELKKTFPEVKISSKPKPRKHIRKFTLVALFAFAIALASLTLAHIFVQNSSPGKTVVDLSENLSKFQEVTPLPHARNMHGTAVANHHLFAFSGVLSSGFTQTVYTAEIKSDGALGEWFENIPLPENLHYIGNSVVVVKDVIYVCGGVSADMSTPNSGQRFENNSVYYAKVSGDGRLSPWKRSAPWPDKASICTAAVSNGRHLYILGGEDLADVVYDSVFNASILENGDLGPWESTMPLPSPLWFHNAFYSDNAIYVAGGISSVQASNASDRFYKAKILPDGKLGFWQLLPHQLSIPVYSSAQLKADNFFLLFYGRTNRGKLLPGIHYILNDGEQAEGWRDLNLPLANRLFSSAAFDPRSRSIYLVGGRSSRDRTTIENKVTMIKLLPSADAAQEIKIKLTPISLIDDSWLDKTVTIHGKVTYFQPSWSQSAPNMFILNDGDSEITAVYWATDKDHAPPDLPSKTGDFLRLTGVVNKFQGRLQIKIEKPSEVRAIRSKETLDLINHKLSPKSTYNLPTGDTTQKPPLIPIANIGNHLVNRKVAIHGRIASVISIGGGRLLEIKDDTGDIVVPLWDRIAQGDPRMTYINEGDEVSLQGSVYVYDKRNQLQISLLNSSDIILHQQN